MGDVEGSEGFQAGAEGGGEFDGVLGSGEEGRGVDAPGGGEEGGDVLRSVGAVVGEGEGGGESAFEFLEVSEEGPGAGEAAEGESLLRGRGGEDEGAADEPLRGLGGVAGGDRGEGRGFFFAEEDGVCAAEGAKRLAEVAGGKECVARVFGGERRTRSSERASWRCWKASSRMWRAVWGRVDSARRPAAWRSAPTKTGMVACGEICGNPGLRCETWGTQSWGGWRGDWAISRGSSPYRVGGPAGSTCSMAPEPRP